MTTLIDSRFALIDFYFALIELALSLIDSYFALIELALSLINSCFALIAYIDSLGFFGRDHANLGRICCKTNFRFMRQPTTFHLAHKSTTLVWVDA